MLEPGERQQRKGLSTDGQRHPAGIGTADLTPGGREFSALADQQPEDDAPNRDADEVTQHRLPSAPRADRGKLARHPSKLPICLAAWAGTPSAEGRRT